jgi:uncharacterized protein (TIGR02246 family)
MPTYIAAMLLTSVMASAPIFAADASEAELMAAAIDLGHRYDANYAAKDAAGMTSLYAPDGALLTLSGQVVRGRAALHDFYAKSFASGVQGHSITVREVHMDAGGGYAIADFSISVPEKGGELHKINGNLVAIYQHDSNGWHLTLMAPSVPVGKVTSK